ncbi:MAG: ATP-grasp domain-containing protein [Armatimonadota bacterium]
MTKVLILGAGVYQIPLIQKALDLGSFHVIAASYSATDPGMSLAHECWVVDTTDKESILQRARSEGINAITTTGTDVAVPTIGYVCDHLGLPGVSYETALMATDKVRMQERFAECNVPSAQSRRVSSLQDAAEAAKSMGYPVMVKAPDSSGSRGISRANDVTELDAAFADAKKHSRSGDVLIEEYLTGTEFGAQVIVMDGKVVQCLCHNDTVTPPPVAVPIGHSCPVYLPKDVVNETLRVCESAVAALGIENAICNADLIATPKGVYIFEIGARIGATGIPEIIELHFGINLYEAALRIACGETPQISPSVGLASAILVIRSPKTGELKSMRIPDEVRNLQGVQSIHFDYKEGSKVRAFKTGPDRIGDVFVTAKDAESAEQLAEQVVSMLDLEVTEHTSP